MAKGYLAGITNKKIKAQHHNGIDGNQIGYPQGIRVILKEWIEQQDC